MKSHCYGIGARFLSLLLIAFCLMPFLASCLQRETDTTVKPNATSSETDSSQSDSESLTESASAPSDTSEDTTPIIIPPVKNQAYTNFDHKLPTSEYLFVTTPADADRSVIALHPGIVSSSIRYCVSTDGGATYPEASKQGNLALTSTLYAVTSITPTESGRYIVNCYPTALSLETEYDRYTVTQDTPLKISFKVNVQSNIEVRYRRADNKIIPNFNTERVKFSGTKSGTALVNMSSVILRYFMTPDEYVAEFIVKYYTNGLSREAVVASVPVTVTEDPNFNRDLQYRCYVISPDNSASDAQIDFIYAHFWKVYPIMYNAYCAGYTNNSPKILYIEVKNKNSDGSATYAPAAMGGDPTYTNHAPSSTISFNQKWSAGDSSTFNADCMTHELGHAIQSWGGFPHTEPLADYLRSVYGMHYDIYSSTHEKWGGDNGSKSNPQRNFFIWLCYTYNESYGGNIVQDIFRRIKDSTAPDRINSEGWNYQTHLKKYVNNKSYDELWTEFTKSTIYAFNFRNYPVGQDDFSKLDWTGPFAKNTWQDYMSANRIPLPTT